MKKIDKSMLHLYKKVLKPRKEKIFTGDLVQVIYGQNTGKRGKVLSVDRRYNKIIVEGVQMGKDPFPMGDPIEDNEIKEQYFPTNHVLLIDPKIDQPTSVKLGYLEDGTKVRVSKKTGTIINLPQVREKAYAEFCKNYVAGPLDTLPNKVLEVTYKGEDFEGIKKEFQQYLEDKNKIEKNLVFDD